MRLHISGLLAAAVVVLAAVPARAQNNPFVGAWNITPEAPTRGVYWLEVKDDGGKPTVMFLNRGGSPVPVRTSRLRAASCPSWCGGTAQNRPTVTLRAAGKTVTGTVGTTKVAGERPPTWGACDANGKHTLRQAGRAVRRQVDGRLGHPDGGPADRCGRSPTAR